MRKTHILLIAFLLLTTMSSAQVERERDIIYHRFEGVALTMDVFKPQNPNGIGIIKIVSGGWKSRHARLNKEGFSKPYTDHGYTVFAVVHGSQPRYKVRDIMGFMDHALRFVRANAQQWSIDPEKIGITGASAGGHLSLILATKGTNGDPTAKTSVARASNQVQAVAVFYPPTDYRNWAEPGDMAVGVGKQAKWQPAFGPESETPEGREALGHAMSPIYHITENTPPILIIHGDSDPVVPIFQAQSFQKAAHEKDVITEIIIKEGGAHGWPNRSDDEVHFIKWFNKYLLGKH